MLRAAAAQDQRRRRCDQCMSTSGSHTT